MKRLHIFLLSLFVTNYISPVVAMRRFERLLSARHVASSITPSSRLMSTIPNKPHAQWRDNALFQQLVNDPQCPKIFAQLRELKENEQGVDAQADNFTLQTFLRLAIINSTAKHQVYLTLLEAGAEINRADDEGQTPLHLLAQNSNKQCEAELSAILAWIAHFEPNFDAVDSHGKKPRDYAPNELKHHFEYHAPTDPAKLHYMFR